MLIGLCSLGYGLRMTVDIVGKRRHGERVEAEIVKSVPVWRGSGSRSGGQWIWEITVRYTDRQGVVHEAMPPINDPCKRLAGETVMIYCDADDPEDIILDAWASRYVPTMLPFLFCLIFLPVGCLLWRDSRKEQKSSRRVRVH